MSRAVTSQSAVEPGENVVSLNGYGFASSENPPSGSSLMTTAPADWAKNTPPAAIMIAAAV